MRITSRTSTRKLETTRGIALVFKIAFLSLSFLDAPQLKAQESDTIPPIQEDTLQIAAREQELRRKEEELLQAMRNAEVSSQPKTQAGSAAQQPAGSKSSEITIASGTSAQKSLASADEAIEAVETQTRQVDEHDKLRALEYHPALVAKKAGSPSTVPPQAASIKTHVVEDHPDGTTARRLGTYTRVKRDEYRWPSQPRETSQTHTVTLDDIQREASVRSVSLSHEEVATIRNGSTHLRTGPSRLDTNLLSLPQYSEVSIDYRSGGWYRVKTSRGVRGWVPGNSLLFDAGISPRSAVRIGAVQGRVR